MLNAIYMYLLSYWVRLHPSKQKMEQTDVLLRVMQITQTQEFFFKF